MCVYTYDISCWNDLQINIFEDNLQKWINIRELQNLKLQILIMSFNRSQACFILSNLSDGMSIVLGNVFTVVYITCLSMCLWHWLMRYMSNLTWDLYIWYNQLLICSPFTVMAYCQYLKCKFELCLTFIKGALVKYLTWELNLSHPSSTLFIIK